MWLHNIRVLFTLILMVFILNACSVGDSNKPGNDTGIFSLDIDGNEEAVKIESVMSQIEDWAAEGEIVGAELMMIKDRKIVVHETFGWMDQENEKAMQKNTIFRIRSMTKPFIGTSIMMLNDDGLLDLSDAVSDYLPSFDNDKSRSVTIEQLLTHTGGFSQPGFPRDYESYNSLSEAVDDIGKSGPQVPPGTEYIYSDAGVAILGALVAEISGMPLEDFIQSRILDPLEMTNTYCNLPEVREVRDRISSTYYRDGDEFVKYWDSSMPQAVSYFRASGGMYSTPLDYAKFLYMWMSNGIIDSNQYLPEEAIKNALTPGKLNDHYGYLWETEESFGHGGSDGTIAFALPEQNLMVLYFTQSRSTHTAEVVKSLILKSYGVDTSGGFTRINIGEGALNEYVGRYKVPQVELEITTDGEQLLMRTQDSSELIFYSSAVDEFFHETLDVQLSFVRDNNGEVSGVVITQKGERLEVGKVK